jgi:hypothetical protein
MVNKSEEKLVYGHETFYSKHFAKAGGVLNEAMDTTCLDAMPGGGRMRA